MSKLAHYLQEHMLGEVVISSDVIDYFSTDGSIFTVKPTTIIYPRNASDVRKVARFTWQLGERGRSVPITARGSGTDQSGAAIGPGIVLVFPAHLNKVVNFDSKTGRIVVEPGLNFGALQQVLKAYGRFLPTYPNNYQFSTIGGAIANNATGEKSLKYGSIANYVSGLSIVLANGEVIRTSRLSKRELNKKLGLSTFEGELYRSIDTLIEENSKLIKEHSLNVNLNATGYNLFDVKQKDGFDLTPLIIGSQGTLGLVTEIELESDGYTPSSPLIVGMFEDIGSVQNAITELRNLPSMPSLIEMVDNNFLNLVDDINPNQLKEIILKPYPKVILFVEFDDTNDRVLKKVVKKTEKIFEKYAVNFQVAEEDTEKIKLWKIRQATGILTSFTDGKLRATPFIEDAIVPTEKFSELLSGLYKILDRNKVRAAVWGHAGAGNLQVQPYLDLSQVGDRQKLFRLMDEYYEFVIDLGGVTSAGNNDGRLRASYLPKLYGDDIYALFQKVKKIFDPYGTLNPGVKIDVSINDIKPLLREEYRVGRWHEYMPEP